MTGTLERASRVHVVGIGGAGMSGLARLLYERGAVVSGSDRVSSSRLDELRRLGITTVVGHAPELSARADVILSSPAVADDDPDLVAGLRAGVTLLSRSRALGELSQWAEVVGLCGTHGKTTATSMLVHVLHRSGGQFGWLVGADVVGLGANAHWAPTSLAVEVDESYGSFEEMTPRTLGILNVDADHLDHYGTFEHIIAAFERLAQRTTGSVVAWSDDVGAARVARRLVGVVTVGIESGEWRVADVRVQRQHSSFVLRGPDDEFAVNLRVTGRHNVANAAVAAIVAREVGISHDAIVDGLGGFRGAPRRFEYRGRARGVDVYEDYAHLPAEIATTLATTLAIGYERPLVIFQPHRVTRTEALAEEFSRCFLGAAAVVVTDIYSAGETNPRGITGELVAHALRQSQSETSVLYVESLAEVATRVEHLLGQPPGYDVVLVVGAGDVAGIIPELVRQ